MYSIDCMLYLVEWICIVLTACYITLSDDIYIYIYLYNLGPFHLVNEYILK